MLMLKLTLPITLIIIQMILQAAIAKDLKLTAKLDAIAKQNNVSAYALVVVDQAAPTWHVIQQFNEQGFPRSEKENWYFRVGSITKSFVALSALVLQSKAKLELQTTVKSHLPEPFFSNPWSNTHPIRLVHLLEHTSGLSDLSKLEWDHHTPISLLDGFRRYPNRESQWQAGYFESYSNTNYGLAGLVLEQISGESIDELLAKTVFMPLAMQSATLQLNDRVRENLVPGFNSDGITPIAYWHMAYSSFGALNIKPIEMANLLKMLLDQGKFQGKEILPAKTIARMEGPSSSLLGRAEMKIGYGLGIYPWQRNGHLFYGHGGDADGYLARFAYQRTAGKGYFLVINSFQNRVLRQMETIIEEAFIADLNPLPPPESINDKIAFTDVEAFIGRYEAATSRFGQLATRNQKPQQYLQWRDGTLLLKPNPNAIARRLFRTKPGQYRFESDRLASVLIQNSDLGRVLVTPEGNYLKVE